MYKRILLTLDGSELARAAIGHAAELANGSDTEVVVLTAIESEEALRTRLIGPAYELAGMAAETAELAASTHALQRGEAEEEQKRAKAALEQAGVRKVMPVVAEGLAGNVIVDEAATRGCGAIVMSTRGRSGLGREVTGSVAEYVLRHAGPAAVVLVGPRGA